MRDGLDVVDLENPKSRPLTVRLEPRIMIGAEMSRCAPPMDGCFEQAADVGGCDRPAVHADADEATRTLVHDHEHPVDPEDDGLAAKEVDAPQAVGGVSDERQPRGSVSARGRAIVFSQHAVHNVLVDVDAEWVRDHVRNPWTAEPRVARRELDDGLDRCFARTLRSRRRAARSDPNPQSGRSFSLRLGARLRARRRTISCCLSRFSAITVRTPPGPHSFVVTTTGCRRVSGRFYMGAST